MNKNKYPTKGWVYLDKDYKKIIARALTLPKLFKKLETINKKGVIAKANKRVNAYIG